MKIILLLLFITQLHQKEFALAWKFREDFRPIESVVSVGGDGTIYFGSNNGSVYALDPLSGGVKWKFATKGEVKSSVVAHSDLLLFGSYDGFVYALDGSGGVAWRYDTTSRVHASPCVDRDGDIIIGDMNGNIHILAQDGAKRHTFSLTTHITNSVMSDSEGHLYVGTSEGELVSFEKNGTVNWRFQTGGGIASDLFIDGDTLLVASKDWHLYALDTHGKLKWKYQTLWYLTAPPIKGGDGVLYLGSWDWSVHAISSSDGVGIWTKQPERSPNMSYFASRMVADKNHHLYAASRNNTIYHFDTNGTVVGRVTIEDEDVTSGLTLHPNRLLLIPTDDGSLYAFGL